MSANLELPTNRALLWSQRLLSFFFSSTSLTNVHVLLWRRRVLFLSFCKFRPYQLSFRDSTEKVCVLFFLSQHLENAHAPCDRIGSLKCSSTESNVQREKFTCLMNRALGSLNQLNMHDKRKPRGRGCRSESTVLDWKPICSPQCWVLVCILLNVLLSELVKTKT